MRFSLGAILAIWLSGLQFIAVISVVFFYFISSERVLLNHATTIIDELGRSSTEHSKGFLEPVTQATELAKRLIESNLVTSTEPAEMEKLLFQQMQIVPQFSGMYYGDEQGNFIYVMRSDKHASFRTKFVFREAGQTSTSFIWRDEDYNIVKRDIDEKDKFDPRARPWYVDAKEQRSFVWTDPYIFFSSQNPGITAATPIISNNQLKGVIGVDIEIQDISRFLSRLEIGKSGVAMALSVDKDVIAHPNPELIKVTNRSGSLEFVNINKIEDNVARIAFGDLTGSDAGPTERGRQSKFEYENNEYASIIIPGHKHELPWSIAIYAPLSDFIGGIEENRTRNIWIAIFIALVTGLVGLKIADRIHRPVRDFAARAGRVPLGRVSNSDTPTKTYPELAEADSKISELSRDLSHYARVNMMGQMAEGLAHELNQPLTSITQNVDAALLTLEEQKKPNPELVEILEDMDRQAHHGAEIIRALRGLVRKDDDERIAFDLTELLEQTLQLLLPEANEHGVTISLNASNTPNVIGNRVQIAQVIMNLTRNAIEAVDAEDISVKNIYIETKLIEKFVEVHVADTGPGIDPNFDLFTQFESSKRDGMGLGLSLSRTLIEANNGKIWYEPKSEERSRFCFTIPLAEG